MKTEVQQWFGEYEILSPEEWLKINAFKNDIPRIEDEGLNDSLWTNNVLNYMDLYAQYVSVIVKKRFDWVSDFNGKDDEW